MATHLGDMMAEHTADPIQIHRNGKQAAATPAVAAFETQFDIDVLVQKLAPALDALVDQAVQRQEGKFKAAISDVIRGLVDQVINEQGEPAAPAAAVSSERAPGVQVVDRDAKGPREIVLDGLAFRRVASQKQFRQRLELRRVQDQAETAIGRTTPTMGLVSRWMDLEREEWMASEDRQLWRVGGVLLMAKQPALWAKVFRAAREGADINDGDEMDFINHLDYGE